jgi:hypothetical protein
MKFARGNKSQAEQLDTVMRAGWREDMRTSLPQRWYDPNQPGTYYTLSHATELIQARRHGISSAEVLSRKQHRPNSPADGRTPD